MITILGAGGAISTELARRLAARNESFRLVGRKRHTAPGATEILTADVSDQAQAIRAVKGSKVVHLLVGLKYDHRLWAEMWPRILANTIEACKRAGAKLVFFDNVYMYGKVDGPMTEETPFNPCSKKGEVRAKVATSLINAWKSGSLTAMIARAADFYRPEARTGIPNVMVFELMAKRKKAVCFANAGVPHSYTYAPDAAESLVQLADTQSAWNQTWHVPTSPNPPSGKEFVAMAAKEMGVEPKYRVVGKAMVRLVGLINPVVGEIREMLYQNDSPYLFDSSKYAKAFGFSGTPYAEGIRATAEPFNRAAAAAK
jgi:nucleoside-diphosphate-sugar epimerase